MTTKHDVISVTDSPKRTEETPRRATNIRKLADGSVDFKHD